MATSSPPSSPLPSSDVKNTDIFKQTTVKILDNDDFNLSKPSLTITLSTLKECVLILFHSNNLESEELSIIWEKAAENAPGITWAAVNLKNEKKIAKAFTNLAGDEPYFWAKLKQIPFILVYRQGFPVAFYNGARETQTIVDYALDLACSPNYHERLQVGKSTLSDNRLEMSSYKSYKVDDNRKVSGEFSADKSLRGFDSSVKMKEYKESSSSSPQASSSSPQASSSSPQASSSSPQASSSSPQASSETSNSEASPMFADQKSV